jgi:stage V sporulation protein B
MKMTGMTLDIRHWIIKPGMVGIIMVIIGKYIYSLFKLLSVGPTLTIALTIIGNITIAVFLMVAAGALQKKELIKLAGFKKR